MSGSPDGAPPPSRPSELDWSQRQRFITRLWQDHTTVKDLRRILAADDFFATEKMILTRLQRWGLDRKNKEPEMAAAARMIRERADGGKRSRITVRGQPIDEEAIQKYAKRRRLSIDELIELARSSPPAAIKCRSPSPDLTSVTSPDGGDASQTLYGALHAYMQNSFDNELWVVPDAVVGMCYSIQESNQYHYAFELGEALSGACYYFKQGLLHHAVQFVTAAVEFGPDALFEQSPLLLQQLLYQCASLHLIGYRLNGADTVKQLRNVLRLQGHDPGTSRLYQVFVRLEAAMRLDDFPQVAARALRVYTEVLEKRVGPLSAYHLVSLSSLLCLQRNISAPTATITACAERLRNLAAQLERAHAHADPAHLPLLLALRWSVTWHLDHAVHVTAVVGADCKASPSSPLHGSDNMNVHDAARWRSFRSTGLPGARLGQGPDAIEKFKLGAKLEARFNGLPFIPL